MIHYMGDEGNPGLRDNESHSGAAGRYSPPQKDKTAPPGQKAVRCIKQ